MLYRKCQNQYLDKKLEAHLKLDWYNEQAVKSEARRQANQPVRGKRQIYIFMLGKTIGLEQRSSSPRVPAFSVWCDAIHDEPSDRSHRTKRFYMSIVLVVCSQVAAMWCVWLAWGVIRRTGEVLSARVRVV